MGRRWITCQLFAACDWLMVTMRRRRVGKREDGDRRKAEADRRVSRAERWEGLSPSLDWRASDRAGSAADRSPPRDSRVSRRRRPVKCTPPPAPASEASYRHRACREDTEVQWISSTLTRLHSLFRPPGKLR